ncbi:hypothetical protein ACFO3J_31240 [Streptomyces polygonati]|uniref:PBP domain-containing protein n=1 Tax=Streptomyces polygonati TaxID=1617087 RepID=A0ABV8HV31_9ACTN
MKGAPRTGLRTLKRFLLRLGAGAAIGALLGAAVTQAAQPAAAGTAAPAGGSAVTVSGRGEFKDMRFTVSQTRQLTSQAVTVTWTGGVPTTFAGTQFNTDFVQIMQCWGDDDGTVPANPGPSRTQCQYGASPTTDRASWPGNARDDTRTITYSAQPANYGQDDQYGSEGAFGTGEVPFKSVDGTVIDTGTQNNALFSYNTTNEIDFARTGADGTGKEFFETQTALEAPHLGCGDPVTKAGVTTPRSCWLVIVPQGHLDLDGKPYADRTQVNAGSPVSSTNWKNRIAVKLGFNPVDSSCPLGASERQTVGSELAADAMTSWQAALCPTGTVYGYTEIGEPDARQRLIDHGDSGLAFTAKGVGVSDAVYAPVNLSAAVIGFTIERRAKFGAPESETKISGTKVESINLTPRLVAKLLTESYRNSVWDVVKTKTDSAGNNTLVAPPAYTWAKTNPAGLITDPDFLAYNPEFADLSVSETPATDTDLITALGHSDTAAAVWAWIDADKDARKFLAGIPDPYGMTVNPYYSTNPDLDPGVPIFDPHRDDYPKSDPWCEAAPNADPNAEQCMTDFHPYVDDMHEGALHTRRADTLWKSTWDTLGNPPSYKSPGPQPVGSRFVLTITDAASAARYGLQTAKLLNASGTFTAPTAATLTTAAADATTSGGVKVVDPAKVTAKNGYPLTELVYAAVRPAKLTAAARKDYAGLLRYAVGPGQVSGSQPGELPVGYAPLTPALRQQATRAATTIATWKGGPAHDTSSGPAGGHSGKPSGGGAGSIDGGGTIGGTGTTGGPTGAPAPAGPTPAASATATAAHPAPSYGGGKALAATSAGDTPADPAGRLRYALPIGAGIGALAFAAAPFAGGARPTLPLRVPLPGGGAISVDPARLRRLLPTRPPTPRG